MSSQDRIAKLASQLALNPNDSTLVHTLQKEFLRTGKIEYLFFKPPELDIGHICSTLTRVVKKRGSQIYLNGTSACVFCYASVSFKNTTIYRYRFALLRDGQKMTKFYISIKEDENSGFVVIHKSLTSTHSFVTYTKNYYTSLEESNTEENLTKIIRPFLKG